MNSVNSVEFSKHNTNVAFIHKPDIFIILAESYNSFREQQKEYGIENSKLKQYLQQNNFEIENAFSNYDHTTASSLAIFYMQHHYNKFLEGNHDLTAQGRGLLNGNTLNAALAILKKNNYYTSFIDCGGYLVKQKGELYNYTPAKNFWGHLPSPLEKPMIPINIILKKIHIYIKFMNDVDTTVALKDAMSAKPNDMPGFYFIREGADHVTYEKTPEVWRKNYRELIKEGDRKIISLLRLIQEKSPDSIVVILGDHGGKMYQLKKLSKDDFIKDLYEVLFAVKMPVSLSKQGKWNEYANTAVNLFPKIFNMLSGNSSLLDGLEKKAHSIDRNGKVIAVDGNPVDVKP
ncbi:sulfatase-like hydrolase/transferase [Maridesulfovibrio sp.]|uniref:sulfatase-like hydrolase/transferase n=1 Tax=Maridesulfovibrio sp. TaxID=2795000 RepID=UPI0029CA777F|nr:sulfatase-like hydrolase/transferase [Maridesulfovibrio sp.]